MEVRMELILTLILLPLLGALLLRIINSEGALLFLTRLFSAAVVILSVVAAVMMYMDPGLYSITLDQAWIKYVFLGLEWLIALYIIVVGLKHRKRLAALFAFLGVCAMTWFELFSGAHALVEEAHAGAIPTTFYVDHLAIIMVLVVGVVGGLICLFSAGYMHDYHHHHKEYKNKMSMFFSTLFMFLSAMFGLVLANDLGWLFFCWEVTTFSSFLLIGYTKTTEATNNAFRAAVINLGGGLAFAAAMIFMAFRYQISDLQGMLEHSGDVLLAIPVFLLCFAGITKAAQMPFSSWLLGAMVAPTPTSALLHSSTMVKAGVYLILRMSPFLYDNPVGIFVIAIGAFTFLVTAILAISQSDAKRVLAYSTVSNLGLIILLAGIGTPDAVWAAIMVVIFHAVAKSLLFLSVGSTEHRVGSRDLEDLDTGSLRISRPLAMCLVIGIAGMFLAPFGMLISKWAAMKTLVETNNLIVLFIIAFGSAVTLFFWTKWMGKVVGNMPRDKDEKYHQHKDEGISLFLHAVLTVACCVGFPLISWYMISPFFASLGTLVTEKAGDAMAAVSGMFSGNFNSVIDIVSTVMLVAMVVLLFLVPLFLLPNRNKHKKASVYLAGENQGDDVSFRGGLGAIQKVNFRNWYLTKIFGEKILFGKSALVAALIILIGAGYVVVEIVNAVRVGGGL